MHKETVLIFNRGYLPGKKLGGPVTSIRNFCKFFSSEYTIKIITWDHDFGSSIRFEGICEGWNDVENTKVLYLRENEIKYKNILKIITDEKPVFCYLSGTITSYLNFNDMIIKACKKTQTPVLIVPRGDICKNALKIKPLKKAIAIVCCKLKGAFKTAYFQSTLKEESYYLKKIFSVENNRIFEIPNLPSTIEPELLKYSPHNTVELVFISRITRKKNLIDVIKSVNEAKSTVKLDIYGPIEDENYWIQCKTQIEKAPKNVSITYKGALDPDSAKEVFKQYDAFIFETLSENYGHVIIESLSCGCPVILSKGTTPWDDIDSYAGYTAELGDINSFSLIIDRIARMNKEDYCVLRKHARDYAVKKTDIDNLLKQYRKMFQVISDK